MLFYGFPVSGRRRPFLKDTLSADLVAEEYPKVSLANKAGDCNGMLLCMYISW